MNIKKNKVYKVIVFFKIKEHIDQGDVEVKYCPIEKSAGWFTEQPKKSKF